MASTPVVPKPGEPAVPPAPSVKVFTQEDIDRAAASARDEEKRKLYADIEKEKKRTRELEDQQKVMEAELSGLKADSTDAAKLRGEIEKLRGERENDHKKFSEALEDVLNNQRAENERMIKQMSLDSLKRELIASANGRVITELVHGDTEEALRNSFAVAKQRYESIEADIAKKKDDEYQEKLKGALPKPVETPAASASAENHGGLSAWRQMDSKEWDKNRNDIIENAFAKAGLQRRVPRG